MQKRSRSFMILGPVNHAGVETETYVEHLIVAGHQHVHKNLTWSDARHSCSWCIVKRSTAHYEGHAVSNMFPLPGV